MKIDGIAWYNYVDWQPEHAEVVLDGRFKAEEIEKIHAAVNGASLADAQAEIARLRAALEVEYRRGYERRDAEVKGALL